MPSNYNIDALRNADGTYRAASAAFVRGALRCGHTAHIQTARGTLAIRPYKIDAVRYDRNGQKHFPGEMKGRNWLLEFYPPSHNHGDEIQFRTASLEEATEFAFLHLNGRKHNFQAGNLTHWFSNQGYRDAEVLAVIDDEALIEYVMPGTTNGLETSALVLVRIHGVTHKSHIRNYTHRKLPKRWIRAMHEQGTTEWIGQGQREVNPVPFPSV